MRPTASWSRSSGAVKATVSRSPSQTRGSARAPSSQSHPIAPWTLSITPSSTPDPAFRRAPESQRGGGRLTRIPRVPPSDGANAPSPRARSAARAGPRPGGIDQAPKPTQHHKPHIKETTTMFRSKRNRTRSSPGDEDADAQLRRPRRPVECQSLEDRRSRLAGVRCRRCLRRQHGRYEADRAERGQRRRVPHGRSDHRRGQFAVEQGARASRSSGRWCSCSRRRSRQAIRPSAPRSPTREDAAHVPAGDEAALAAPAPARPA